MSDPENPSVTPKTSAVPLKKETVRITLRARPSADAAQANEAAMPGSPVVAKPSTAPIQLPSAPLPPPAPKSATSTVKLPSPPMPPPPRDTHVAAPVPPPARPPVAPAATAPMAPRPPVVPGVPRPMGTPTTSLPAATRPLAKAPAVPVAAPRVEAGDATVPLVSKPAPKAPGSSGGTGPMVSATAPLPKATVKLQPTQAMQRAPISAPPSAPVKRAAAADSEQFYEEKDPEAGLMPLSAICFVLAAALVVIQMFGADMVKTDVAGGASPIMVPEAGKQKWESRNPSNGAWDNSFQRTELPSIP